MNYLRLINTVRIANQGRSRPREEVVGDGHGDGGGGNFGHVDGMEEDGDNDEDDVDVEALNIREP